MGWDRKELEQCELYDFDPNHQGCLGLALSLYNQHLYLAEYLIVHWHGDRIRKDPQYLKPRVCCNHFSQTSTCLQNTPFEILNRLTC